MNRYGFHSLNRNPIGTADWCVECDDKSLARQIRVERNWEASDDELAAIPTEQVEAMMPAALAACARSAAASLF